MAGKKLIILLNGKPRAGKDTFAMFLNRLVPVLHYSAVTRVKCIALECGWTGKKEEKDRKFLSDLKNLVAEYSDLPFRDMMDMIERFDKGDFEEEIMVIDVREPKEIQRLVEATGAITVFINNDNVPEVTSNDADANVEDYEYDFMLDNSGTLEDFAITVNTFVDFLVAMSDMVNDDEEDDE